MQVEVKNSAVEVKDNAVEITTTIPLMLGNEVVRDLKKALDIIDSFSSRLVVLLTNRKNACIKLLQAHVNDVFFNDTFTIAWHRKDGTIGYFCPGSYHIMHEAIYLLESGEYNKFLCSIPMVDQTIKAIMNEPNLDHSDAGSYKFSDLVSVLCESHLQPNFEQDE